MSFDPVKKELTWDVSVFIFALRFFMLILRLGLEGFALTPAHGSSYVEPKQSLQCTLLAYTSAPSPEE